MPTLNQTIKSAVDVSQRAQRNYDRSKQIPDHDLETMIYAASNSPTKQNETHYAVKVYTNEKIYKIYNTTKHFTLYTAEDFDEVFQDTQDSLIVKQENNVHNSQVLANALFVYFLDQANLRGGHHKVSEKLILSATLMGYKTGICSAFDVGTVQSICNTDLTPKVLVGIGYENQGVDRKYAAETLNKDIPAKFRNGNDNEKWMFPSFDKQLKVSINDE